MARHKKPTGGKHRGGGSSKRKSGFGAQFVDGSSSQRPRNGLAQDAFSLMDEARNTERHGASAGDQRLRNNPVKFVSAGTLRPHEDPGQAISKPETNSEEAGSLEQQPEIAMANMTLDPVTAQPTDPSLSTHLAMFEIDVRGLPNPFQSSFPPPVFPRSPSPTDSNSSEEVILFAGRNRGTRPHPTGAQSIKQTPSVKTEVPLSQQTRSHSTVNKIPGKPLSNKTVTKASQEFIPLQTSSPAINRGSASLGGRKRRGAARNKTWQEEEEAAMIADYIANTRDETKDHEEEESEATPARTSSIPCEVDDELENPWQDTSDQGSAEMEWSSDDIRDFDDIETSSEISFSSGLPSIILSKRTRESGMQYLVVLPNSGIDDARWLPVTVLGSIPAAAQAIVEFEAKEQLAAKIVDDFDNSDSEVSTDEQTARDLEDALDDLMDEDDLVQRRRDRMTDEQIARRLAKQEELGLGSDEIILFDGEEDEHDDEDEDMDVLQQRAFAYTVKTKAMRSKQSKGTVFASASAFADALDQDPYHGFDVMDQERPSLRKKNKGRRNVLGLELSDEELEEAMNIAWQNDRAKKSLRRREREKLRAQGLLGVAPGKVDLEVKYPEGMMIGQIKSEIKSFMLSDKEALNMVPMDKKDRKTVHEFANAFNLKSKSLGSGNSRYPCLFKTRRTIPFDEKVFGMIQARFNRGFLPRLDRSARAAGRPSRPSGRGGGHSAAGYRDGEVIGGTALEIGADNKGRAMLEKMGWSSGTGLGALNNKGNVQPIMAEMKATRIGLG